MPVRTQTFPTTRRLHGSLSFRAVYDARTREVRGPLVMYARPNELGHPRWGISIGRPVGTAVRRNRIKRLLRESFRRLQHDLPVGYDLVVSVRPHQPMPLADYQKILASLMLKLHNIWLKRVAT